MNRYTLLILFAFIFNSGMAHVKLNYPEGGETFFAGQEITIEWEELVQHNTQNWDLYYSLNGGETWEELAMDIDYEMRSYDWTVLGMPSSEARIKVIQDNTGFDYEDESGDFTITEQVGINESSVVDFRFYPNPAKDYIMISANTEESGEITIHDLKGNLIKQIPLEAMTEANHTKIDLHSYSSGIYIISIQSGATINTRKLLIE